MLNETLCHFASCKWDRIDWRFSFVSSYSHLMITAIAVDAIRYEMLSRLRSKADVSQLNLPHGTNS